MNKHDYFKAMIFVPMIMIISIVCIMFICFISGQGNTNSSELNTNYNRGYMDGFKDGMLMDCNYGAIKGGEE